MTVRELSNKVKKKQKIGEKLEALAYKFMLHIQCGTSYWPH